MTQQKINKVIAKIECNDKFENLTFTSKIKCINEGVIVAYKARV